MVLNADRAWRPVAGTSFDANESPYASGGGATYHLSNHYYKVGSDYWGRTGGFLGAFTFEVWIKCASTPPTGGGTILGYDGARGGGKIFFGNSAEMAINYISKIMIKEPEGVRLQ